MFVIVKLQDVSNFAGLDGFCWFVGQVEARVITHDAGTRTVTQTTYDADGNQNGTEQVQVSGVTTIPDPLRLGRVKVRCIGYHTQDRDQLPTEDLPWATVLHPITSPGISGVGTNPFLIEGTTVFGFFLDAHDKQHPVILGCFAGRDAPGASSDYRVSSRTGATGPTLADAEPYEQTGEVEDDAEDVVTCAENGVFGPSTIDDRGRTIYSNYIEGKSNSNIRGLLKEYGGPGVARYVGNKSDSQLLWCAAWASAALNRCGFKSPNTTGSQVFGTNASQYGDVIATGKDFSVDKLKKGDVIVYKWPAGSGSTGHVGFYTGESKPFTDVDNKPAVRIGVLGGNQSNALSSKLMGTKDIAYVVRPKRTSASLTASAAREV